MKSKLINALLWALRRLGYSIPIIRPVDITPRDMQRVRAQEIVTYHLLDQTRPGIKHLIERRIKEAFSAKVAELAEVREEPTPDGVKYYCDMLVINFPKPDEGQVI
jgi:hypothetical protein